MAKVKRHKFLSLNILVVLLIGAGVFFYFYQGEVVATVNGRPIFKADYIRALEKNGKVGLDEVIKAKVIEQQARRLGVVVSDAEVDGAIASYQAQMKKEERVSAMNIATGSGLKRGDYEAVTRRTLIVKKLAAKENSLPQSEVLDFIAKNKNALQTVPVGQKEQAVREYLLVRKYLSDLVEQADIQRSGFYK